MTPVSSSSVRAIGYLDRERTLVVDYIKTGVYHYRDVPVSVYAQVVKAESVGKAINALVKPYYEYAKA